MMNRTWQARLRDERSGRVIFLSHCLLNDNARYLGGVPRCGPVPEIVRACTDRGIGIVQLPCPEARAWGGVLKRRLLAFFGARGTLRYRAGMVFLPLMLAYTRAVYRRLARSVAREIADHVEAGVEVLGVVGLDPSPSCGVHRTVHVRGSVERLGALRADATSADVNAVIAATAMAGEGLFVTCLRRRLERLGLRIPFGAHDLLRDLEGRPSSFDPSSLRAGV